MKEMKTAEEFLKEMKPQVREFDKHDKVAKIFDYYDMTGFAEQYAKSLPTPSGEQEDGWIPVSERLPEKEGDYFIYYHSPTYQTVTIEQFDGSRFSTFATHWRELPSPPKQS